MIAVPVFNPNGDRTGQLEVDPALFGGEVRPRLIKQAIVAFLDHSRQDSARTKGRSDTEGSTRKLFRQKGTGNARPGSIRTPVRRGGGRAFSKRGERATKTLPKKMRRLARNSAILAKLQSEDVMVLDGFTCAEPKTKPFAAMLKALGVDRSCVVALADRDHNAYLSGRNIPGTRVRLVDELFAYEVLRHRKLIFTKPAFERLIADPVTLRVAEAEEQG